MSQEIADFCRNQFLPFSVTPLALSHEGFSRVKGVLAKGFFVPRIQRHCRVQEKEKMTKGYGPSSASNIQGAAAPRPYWAVSHR